MSKKNNKKKNYYRFDMDMKVMNILASILYIAFYIYVFASSYIFSNSYFNTFEFDFLGLMGLFVYLVLHELCHGLGYALFAKDKKNIKFGAILEKGVFYAMCQEEINKKEIIVSLIFPVLILTLIPLPFALYLKSSVLLFYAITNLIGAIGDIFMIILIFKLPKDITYIDFDNNIGAYFICDEDISSITSFGLNCAKTDTYDEKLIDKSIPRVYISPSSKKYFLIFAILIILLFIINMI